MARFVKRGKSWQYEISHKTDDGQFKKIRKSGFKTKSDAKVAATDLEYELARGYKVNSKETTLYDYFESWMKLYKKNTVSEVTYRRYNTTLATIKNLMPFVTLQELSKNSYQKYLNIYADGHAKDTVKRFHMHVRACVLNAIDEKVLLNDFTRNALIHGSVQQKKKEDKFLQFDELKKVIHYAEKDLNPQYASRYMIIVGANTGMRFSELLGLTWNDIDFDNKTITINKTWQYQTGGGFGPTKNEASIRTIDTDDHTLELLKKYKIDQDALGLENEFKLIFYNEVNGPISNNAVNKSFKNIQTQVGINNPITFHGLRHTHASLLLYKKVDIMVLSERLGHSDITVTSSVYAHVINELRKQNKERIVSVIETIYE